MDVGLGGTYAEEICARAGIDKKTSPNELAAGDVDRIHKELVRLVKELRHPKGFVYDDIISPVPLKSIAEGPRKRFSTYNEALDLIQPLENVSPYQKKMKQLQHIIELQEETVKKLNDDIEESTKKAELIYNNYQKLEKLLEIVTRLRKEKGWEAVREELKKEKKIVGVDLKNKKIIIEL
jgi:predicted ribosome quality control (RQC) complex YloA/Tae2 family protein